MKVGTIIACDIHLDRQKNVRKKVIAANVSGTSGTIQRGQILGGQIKYSSLNI